MSDDVVHETALSVVTASSGSADANALGRRLQGFADALERAGGEYLIGPGVAVQYAAVVGVRQAHRDLAKVHYRLLRVQRFLEL